jgi:hypothetical protein
MAKTKGIFCFRGSVGGSGKLHLFRSEILGVKSVSPVSNLTTFCGSMAPKTNALIRELTYCISQAYSTADPPADRNVDRIATVFYREGSAGTVRRFSFPLPVASIVEDRSSGERLTVAAVEEIVGFIATATGQTLYPLYGIVTQKR